MQGSEADNALEGTLYNEYALGSRIQYQVRVGEQVFVIEKLRQQPFTGKRGDTSSSAGTRKTAYW